MEITDRGGRVWKIENYESPSGPAFHITVPDGPAEAAGWASQFTAHFNGSLFVVPPGGDAPQGRYLDVKVTGYASGL